MSARLPSPGDLIGGKYRVEHLLGQGGMGAVFRATHVAMEKPVALKWLLLGGGDDAMARERFQREARIAARIRHPNVVDVYDVGDEAGAQFMVMELLEGEPFSVYLERDHAQLREALGLLLQAMAGVAAAHARGVVHRDIKPENLYVVHDPLAPAKKSVKVLDFGISKVTEAHGGHVTTTGTAMGTPMYMSIEQMRGVRDVDVRTDVYSFGVLLYRVLTGRLPFAGDSFAGLAVAVATEVPRPPLELRPDLPAALSALTLKAMARDRDQRHPTLEALMAALRDALERDSTLEEAPLAAAARPSRAAPTSASPVEALGSLTAGQRSRPRPVWLAAAVGVAVSAGGLGAWASRTGLRERANVTSGREAGPPPVPSNAPARTPPVAPRAAQSREADAPAMEVVTPAAAAPAVGAPAAAAPAAGAPAAAAPAAGARAVGAQGAAGTDSTKAPAARPKRGAAPERAAVRPGSPASSVASTRPTPSATSVGAPSVQPSVGAPPPAASQPAHPSLSPSHPSGGLSRGDL